MILFIFGYFAMELIFFIWRAFYHIFSKKNLILALKKDFLYICAYDKKVISSNPIKIKIILGFIIAYIISQFIPLQINDRDIFENAVTAIIYFLTIVIFLPKEESSRKGFPVEIFGFIYSIIMMYCSAGDFVIDKFYTDNGFNEDMWIYGYIVVMISYLICIATLSRFMERNLSRLEVIFLGMIMMTILEFMTYYGIGFFGGIKFLNPQIIEYDVLNFILTIINQGIFVASQNQILERSAREILGYIILNGTDALTVTAVLGYVLQKFMGLRA